jgi:predicted permease
MLKDLRYAFRTLRQNPGFALIAIVSIALAIGANSSIFSLADVLLLRPLPVPDASHVVSLRSIAPSSTISAFANTGTELSYPDYLDFHDKSRSFDGLIGFSMKPAGFTRDERSQAELKVGYLVTGNFFAVLGVEPSIGRAFRAEEDQVPGRDAVLVLSHDFWAQEFAADASVIGRHVRVNGIEFTVVGVAPKAFTGMDQFVRPAFFVPMMMASRLDPAEDLLRNRAIRRVSIKGRLKPEANMHTAGTEIASIAKSLEDSYPVTNKGFGAAVRTELQMRLDRSPVYGQLMFSLFTLVGIVLLIACCNVANLMLSRGRARSRELAVRVAIGASRGRLIRQLMAEGLLIALAGGALGLLITQAAADFFGKTQTLADVPVTLNYQIDQRVLGFTLLVSVVSAVLFTLLPSIRSTKLDLTPILKAGALTAARTRFLGRSTLVVAQIAGSVVLLTSAAGAYKSSTPLLEQRGFRTDHLLTVRLDTAVAGYNADQSKEFYSRLVEASRTLPGVKSAAFSSSIPLTSFVQPKTVIPEHYQFPPSEKSASVLSSTVDERYFGVLGIPVTRGRSFLPADTADSPRVIIVNNAFAEKYLGTDPIGKRIRLENENGPWAEVVGVVATGKYLSLVEPPTGFVYLPFSQNPEQRMTMLVESQGDPATLAAPVRELLRSLNPNVPVLLLRTMEDIFQRTSVQGMNLVVTILGSLGIMGLVLALAGLYAVVAYQVARRTREIGIRVALGAERLQVLKMILKHAARMGITGVVIGVALSLVLRGVIDGGSDPAPIDLWLYMAVPLSLLLMTILAAAVPARNAMRVDPQIALREE